MNQTEPWEKLKLYIDEFIAICSFLSEKSQKSSSKAQIFISKNQLEKMLDKNLYAEAEDKLRVWRNLFWIMCEPQRFTKSITIGGKRKRVVVLNISAYEQLMELITHDQSPQKQQKSTGD